MLKKALVMMCGMMVAAGLATTTMADEHEGVASAGLDVVSAYVFRGATVNDEVNVQPALNADFGALDLGVWANFNTDSSNVDEIDLTASYDLPLSADLPVSASVGYTEYTYPTASAEADREVSLTLSPVDCPLDSSILVAVGFEGALDEGIYVEANCAHDLVLSEGLTINATATVAAQLGDNTPDTGLAFVALGAGTTVGPIDIGVTYYLETDEDVQLVDEDVVGTASIGIPL
jgi:hypothetical protein